MQEDKVTYYLNLIENSGFPFDHAFDADWLKKLMVCNNLYSNIGIDVVKVYHPSIWRCNIKDHRAPIDAWNDPVLMAKVIENRIKYLKTEDLSLYNIRAGLSISKLAPKVSIFRPAAAKYLIDKYLSEFSTIFDPCAGFSGRLLGTTATNKYYIGQDINSVTVAESNKLIKDMHINAQVSLKNSIYDTGNYDCLFTCPPYGNKETWHQDIEIFSADEWIDICLKNYNCKAYLFVVDNTVKYKDYIVEEIKNTSHFSKNTEKVILVKK